MRLSKITTKTGDHGSSALADGERLPKSHPIFHLLGDLDELNAWIGSIRASADNKPLDEKLEIIQQDLFNLGGEIATKGEYPMLDKGRIEGLENDISNWNKALPPLKEFMLPGGSELLSKIHIARSITRRTERSLCHPDIELEKPQTWGIYLNRLSDWLFVLARFLNKDNAQLEPQWKR